MKITLGVVALVLAASGCGGGSSPSCSELSGPCTFSADCCDSAQSCVKGVCGALGEPTCGAQGGACGAPSACCSGLTCSLISKTCVLGQIGDPCTLNAQCADNLSCNGLWCTRSCTNVQDCVGGSVAAECALIGGQYWCEPLCTVGAPTTCEVYASITTCANTQILGEPGAGVGTLPVCQ
jgi:hypothetical protein